MAESDKLSKEDLRALAAELDASGDRSVEPEAQTQEPPEGDMSLEDTSPAHLSQEEAEKEYEKQQSAKKAETEDSKAADSSDTIDVEPKSKDEKNQDRLDRNWKKMQEREQAAKLLMDEAIQIKAELAKKEREAIVKQKPPDLFAEQETNPDGTKGYSVKQYQEAAKQAREDGNLDIALQAEEKARTIYTEAFKKIWMANLESLTEEDPDLSDSKKPISVKCNEILNALPFLKTLPDGCKYAYRIAQGDTSKSMISGLKAENQKLKKEVEKLNYATRLTGSGPARYSSGDKKFEDMDKKERKAHLRALAEQADAGY